MTDGTCVLFNSYRLLNKLRCNASAILGDQMGLGKTVQTVVFASAAHALGLVEHTVLVVVPLSTVPNWMNELRKWCPGMNFAAYVGNASARETCRMYDFPATTAGGVLDVMVTSYEVAMADSRELQKIAWGAVIVDEGHRLKNFQSRLSKTLSTLDTRFRCLLTGTPLQNNLEELFALLHFLDPGKFKDPAGLADAFTAGAEALIAGKGDKNNNGDDGQTTKDDESGAHMDAQLKSLHGLLGAHMLRRLKKDVLEGLPKMRKVEVACQLSPIQREVYADVLARNHKAFNQGAHAREKTSLLNVLKELQKVCNHPFLFLSAEKDTFRAARKSGLAKKVALEAEADRKSRSAELVIAGSPAPPDNPLESALLRSSSGKMQLLAKLLPRLRERGHRILLFCQMTRMLDLLEDWLRASGVGFVTGDSANIPSADQSNGASKKKSQTAHTPVYGRIDGSMPSADRQRAIVDFNTPGTDTFLLLVSTRAGGLGLNLATADTIVLYDPDFNPFVDLQAQSRAHRMGQTREVAVYQLVTAGTVEERIVSMAKSKLAIERLVVKDEKDTDTAKETAVSKKAAEARRGAELAQVLMHGARGIMTDTEDTHGAHDAEDADRRRVMAAAEPTDAEIARLLDRAALPAEVDGEDEDGAAYLGEIGVEGAEGDAEGGAEGGADEEAKGVALVDLLASRAARLGANDSEDTLGQRERREVLPNPHTHGSNPNPKPLTLNHCNVCDGDDDPEGMLRCRGCTACAHALCLGLGEVPAEREWFCGDGECAEVGEPLETRKTSSQQPAAAAALDDADVHMSDGEDVHPGGKEDDDGDEDYTHAEEPEEEEEDDDDDDFHIASLPVGGSKRRKTAAPTKAVDHPPTADAIASVLPGGCGWSACGSGAHRPGAAARDRQKPSPLPPHGYVGGWRRREADVPRVARRATSSADARSPESQG